MKNSKLMVSVWITAYNHKEYIAKALDSVLMQETDFEYEIVIGEDCSTDGTREILIAYQKKYPEKIKLLLHEENLGQMKNSIATWQACQGIYVAMLDSDDYWGDPLKLQKQVDFLETHSEFAISYHDSNLVDDKGDILSHTCHYRKDYSQDELISGIATMPTSATMLRNMQIVFPDFFVTSYQPDTILVHYAGLSGKAKFQDNIENSAYRIHTCGIWSGIDLVQRALTSIETRRLLMKNLQNNQEKIEIIKTSIVKTYLEYLYVLLRSRDFKNYFKLLNIMGKDSEVNSVKIYLLHTLDVPKRMFMKFYKSITGKKA